MHKPLPAHPCPTAPPSSVAVLRPRSSTGPTMPATGKAGPQSQPMSLAALRTKL